MCKDLEQGSHALCRRHSCSSVTSDQVQPQRAWKARLIVPPRQLGASDAHAQCAEPIFNVFSSQQSSGVLYGELR